MATDVTIKRFDDLENYGGQFLYAVQVDTSEGFELCPADACRIDAADASGVCPAQAPGAGQSRSAFQTLTLTTPYATFSTTSATAA